MKNEELKRKFKESERKNEENRRFYNSLTVARLTFSICALILLLVLMFFMMK